MSILPSTVINSSLGQSTSTAQSSTTHDTDHRMVPQKRILEEEFSIMFPSKKTNPEVSGAASDNPQEIGDFKLALSLQQEERIPRYVQSSMCILVPHFELYKRATGP